METTLTCMAAREVGTHRLRPEDFEWIVPQYQRQIYRLLLSLLRDADAADNLTQECFLRAFRSHASFRGESGIATWLMRIAINLAYDHNKNRRRAFWRRLAHADPAVALNLPAKHRSPEGALMTREKLDVVWSAVQELPQRQRTAFVLRFAEEMPLEAIARAMGLEVGTVKAHLSRAVETVRNVCRRSGNRVPDVEARE